jgi:hypothetical protein
MVGAGTLGSTIAPQEVGNTLVYYYFTRVMKER